MSEIAQFLGMREHHDKHRKGEQLAVSEWRSWRDCDTCLAIAAWDELMRGLENLTPGGSDFFRDPDHCLRFVADNLRSKHELLVARSKTLTVRNRELDELETAVRKITAEGESPAHNNIDARVEAVLAAAKRAGKVLDEIARRREPVS